MPFFKTTHNIFVDNKEYFDINWMDSDKLVLPPNPKWDYSREIKIEDVDIWEVLWQASGGWGLYAAWCPYAEFYLLTYGFDTNSTLKIDTFYGQGAQKRLVKKLKEFNIPYSLNEVWVDPEDMWLYQN